METTNNTTEIVEKQDTEIGIHTPKTTIKTPDEFIIDKITKTDNTGVQVWMAFDYVRSGLGVRDIYGSGVFFASLRLLNFIEKEENGKDYRPTDDALIKYPNWFVLDSSTKKWGMRPGIRHEFEEKYLHPIYAPMASRVMAHMKEEKRIVKNNRSREKRAKERRDEILEEFSIKPKGTV